MFGLGFPEIIFILLLATIILGPEHMPRAARMIGRWSAKMRSAATSFEQAIANDQDLKDVKSDIQELKSELKSGIDETKSALNEARMDIDSAGTETRNAFQQARDELRDFQASTGRYAPESEASEPETEISQPTANPEPSAFMSRPLGCCAPPSATHQKLSHISLMQPKLLPSEISRQVSRKRIQLPEITNHADSGTAHFLPFPNPLAPALKIRHLSAPRHPVSGTQTVIPLPPRH